MYLTKLEIPLASRQAVNCLRDAQQMHVVLSKLFNAERKTANVLYRTGVSGGTVRIYAYSGVPVSGTARDVTVAGSRDLSGLLENMREGNLYSFDVLAVPAKKVAKDGAKNSQRRLLRTPEERLEWLSRKGEQNGFRLLRAEEIQMVPVYAKHGEEKGSALRFEACRFRGVLCVDNAELFRNAVKGGIGSGKAYGCGMLLLKAL